MHPCMHERTLRHPSPKTTVHATDTTTVHPTMIHLLASVILAVSAATAMHTPRSGALACGGARAKVARPGATTSERRSTTLGGTI